MFRVKYIYIYIKRSRNTNPFFIRFFFLRRRLHLYTLSCTSAMTPSALAYSICACIILQQITMTTAVRCYVCKACFKVDEQTPTMDGCVKCFQDGDGQRRQCIRDETFQCHGNQYCCQKYNLCNEFTFGINSSPYFSSAVKQSANVILYLTIAIIMWLN